MYPQAFIFIGRSGAGKGTQAALLMSALRRKDSSRQIQYIQTGLELREFIKGDSVTERMTNTAYRSGMLMPEFLTVYVWVKALVERYVRGSHLVFSAGNSSVTNRETATISSDEGR